MGEKASAVAPSPRLGCRPDGHNGSNNRGMRAMKDGLSEVSRAFFMMIALIVTTSCSRADREFVEVEMDLNSAACSMSVTSAQVVGVAAAVAEPSLYDGKLISVIGYYCGGFEMSGLYPEPDCASRPGTGLWLQGLSPFYEPRGRRVRVTGIFDTNIHGHLSQWPAGICVAGLEESAATIM